MEENSISCSMICQCIVHGQLSQRLTRKFLQQQDDCEEWRSSEYNQLDSYKSLNMFGEPFVRPNNSNVLPLIWTYIKKLCGTKKARCVRNGSPRIKGTVSMAHAYTQALEQPGTRTFRALTALHNNVVYGADETNTFAEAPPPLLHLCLWQLMQHTDTAGRKLNVDHLSQNTIYSLLSMHYRGTRKVLDYGPTWLMVSCNQTTSYQQHTSRTSTHAHSMVRKYLFSDSICSIARIYRYIIQSHPS